MGKKSTPAPPPAPDYQALAQQQADLSKEAVNQQTTVNRYNQVTPYGNLTWTQGPNDQWTATQTLSPEQQQLLNTTQAGTQQLANTATAGLGRVQNAYAQPFDISGLPAAQGNVAVPQAQTVDQSYANTPYGSLDFSSAPAYNPQQAGAGPQLQTSLDLSGLPQLNQDYAQQRANVENALYQRNTAILDPQYQQQEEQMRARLINSGLNPGTAAYDQAVNDFYRQKQQAYDQARTSSILAGGQEQSRLNADALAAYNSLFGTNLAAANFGNSAQQQQYQNATTAGQLNNAANLGARQQAIGEQTSQAQFGNQAAQQNLNSILGINAANNAANSANFGQNLAAANLANSVRAQGLNEQTYLRNQPLNEYNALMTGAQVQAPQFQGTNTSAGQYTPANVYGAAQDQYRNALDMFNYQQAQQAAANPYTKILGAAGNFFTGNWGQAGQQVGSLFGPTGTQFGG